MIIYMSDIIVVTNRHLCRDDFLLRVEKIAQARPAGIILREKDMEQEQYKKLAIITQNICRTQGILCILHNFVGIAEDLGATAIHLPLPVLRKLSKEKKEKFTVLGASCHSVEDAREAEALGCTYITAGHIFETNCKKGLPGRGIFFLREVCESISIPVYAIGGISAENMKMIKHTRAAGACVMNGPMVCEDMAEYLKILRDSE